MRHIERRRAVSMRLSKKYTALRHYAVHMIDTSGNESFEKIFGLRIAQLLEPRPKLRGGLNLLHADARRLRTRLQQPRTRYVPHELAQVLIIEDMDELRHEHADFLGPCAHSQLVAKVPNRGQPNARQAQVFADRCDIF